MRLIRWFVVLSLFLIATSCQKAPEPVDLDPAKQTRALTTFVNPFIGTGGHGHTYPGASAPFGMMQLSPDTRLAGWDGCSGYHYSDNVIYGFSHTHLSGTGVSDYGDILLMPSTQPILNNGADGNEGYSSHFSHQQEQASPGYYEVVLDNNDIQVKLTVSQRSGIHQYQFKDNDEQYVILDLTHRDKLLEHELNFEGTNVITGKRFSSAWAEKQMLFFAMETSHPVMNRKEVEKATGPVYAIMFDNPNNEPIEIKIAISPVDIAGAKANLAAEIGDKTFEQVQQEVEQRWEKELSKIIVEDENTDALTIFYTSLYHSMLAPNLYQDVDGRYRGMDLEVHSTTDFDYYTVFSLWDTYRAAHPLYTILDQERSNDFIKTFIAKYDEGGILPIWDLSGNYTGCMIGYHAVPVIADAYLKGINDYDVEKAYEAIKHSATRDKLGLESYKKLGFIPVELESESVSKTLEYAFDDWSIAQMAKELGKEADVATYLRRAQNYKNVFNPATGFMQGRYRNSWFSPFDPVEVNFNYTEANAWQYSLYVPQDIAGHIALMGGDDQYEAHLDSMFRMTQETSGRHQADITGLIGQYAHGNEPSHHMAYLYNFVGKPHKTQEKTLEILNTLYTNSPDGISGNEDCGQMSAWYVLSSMGFYPVTPASNTYIISSPLHKKASIHLENGKVTTILKEGDGIYIKDITYHDGTGKQQSHRKSFFTHKEIMNGGTYVFHMTNTPEEWGTNPDSRPVTHILDHPIISTPYIEKGDISFPEKTTVALAALGPDATIHYSLGADFTTYSQPFTIDESAELTIYASQEDKKSPAATTQFFKYDKNRSIELGYTYANEYSAGGNDALIDGMRGTIDFRSGSWQGIKNQDLDLTLDLGNSQTVQKVSLQFLKDQRSWIFYPKDLTVELLDENKTSIVAKTIALPETGKIEERKILTEAIEFDHKNVRFVKVHATTFGKLPKWHLGYPYDGTAWIFVDELEVE